MTPTSLGPYLTIRLHYQHVPVCTPDDPHGENDFPKAEIADVVERFDSIIRTAKSKPDAPCTCGATGLRVYLITIAVSRTQCIQCGLTRYYTIGMPPKI